MGTGVEVVSTVTGGRRRPPRYGGRGPANEASSPESWLEGPAGQHGLMAPTNFSSQDTLPMMALGSHTSDVSALGGDRRWRSSGRSTSPLAAAPSSTDFGILPIAGTSHGLLLG